MNAEPSAIREALRTKVDRPLIRISWMALSCIGFVDRDSLHGSPETADLLEVAQQFGIRCIGHRAMASVILLEKPNEQDLLTQISRLREGNRILVFNDECDIAKMKDRCFEIVTACIFDHESKRVLRVFDGYKPRRVESYIDVELSDVNDTGLAISAARIAGLR